jgi:predicted acetyltransferase
VGITLRAISEAEIPAWTRTDAAGFGEDADELSKRAPRWIADELDRTRAAFDGADLVGTSRNHTFELTVPGGALVPAAGVSAVAVLPTHRRRGILRAMLTALLDDSADRSEPVSMLTASEGAIYRRFGFGISTMALDVTLDVRDVEFARPRPGGHLRMVDRTGFEQHAPALFDRVRPTRPGAVSRSEVWWAEVHPPQKEGTRFDVLYESDDGRVDGFVTYTIKDNWAPEPEHALKVFDLVAASPIAEHALWRYLCEIDLVRTVGAGQVAVDTPLPWLLASPRAALFQPTADFVWTRVLDVPRALGARTYATPGRLVIAVHDAMRPGGGADGVFAIEGGPDGASVAPTHDAPDLTCEVTTLSTAWLGAVRWSVLASAGWVDEHTPGALATADAMFASAPLPSAFTWF